MTNVPKELTATDRQELARLGIAEAEVARQLELFRHPPPKAQLDRVARVGDGIVQIPLAQQPALIALAEQAALAGRCTKFVPASGAASRMFQQLAALALGQAGPEEEAAGQTLCANLERFAFWEELVAVWAGRNADLAGASMEEWLAHAQSDSQRLAACLLQADGLGYGLVSKGLIPFHRHPEGSRTALEEQLREAGQHIRDRHGECRVHLTVTPQCQPRFVELFARIRTRVEGAIAGRVNLSFSTQMSATDTVAVDLEGQLVRIEDGQLLLRPGGHGALLYNLEQLGEQLGGDLVFIKNIDNVLPEARLPQVVRWKKILAGHLLELEKQIDEILGGLASGAELAGAWLERAVNFAADQLALAAARDFRARPDADPRPHLWRWLHRPLRVCGVVPNRGEPGGGPFWMRDADGGVTLQIVETAQIDRLDPQQQAILAESTHFNPVDLVCRMRDHRGQPYALAQFVDPTTAFISEKSHAGRKIRCLEHPGLWNGSMGRWNTVFVEVPAETFAPVKTVFDLLRPEHQG